MNYRPEIDGLRAVAVVPVILFHAGFTGFSGGFVGVDVFFVISGYLITGIILRELLTQNFSLAGFYERRARRILPMLFVVSGLSIPPAFFLLEPSRLVDFSQSVVSVLFFLSNVLFWMEAGYFDTAAEVKPLLHTWSLAVEEQYYVLFPLFLMISFRLGMRATTLLLSLVLLISLCLSEWASYYLPSANFYLLPTRGWEILIGALCAIALLKGKDLIADLGSGLGNFFSLLGIALIIYSVVMFSKETRFPGFAGMVPTIGTALVILFAGKGTLVLKILSLRWLVGIGLVSYSAYLIHQPLFAYYRLLVLPVEHRTIDYIGLMALTALLSYGGWRYVENFFRDRNRLGVRSLVTILLVSGLGLLSVGLSSIYYSGFPGRYDSVRSVYPGYNPDNIQLREESWEPLRTVAANQKYGVSHNEYDLSSWYKDPEKMNLLLVGNSHSKDLYNVFSFSETIGSRFETARFGLQVRDLRSNEHVFFQSANYRDADIIVIASYFDDADLQILPWLLEQFKSDGKKPVLVQQVVISPNQFDVTLADRNARRLVFGGVEVEIDLVNAVNALNATHYDVFNERRMKYGELRSRIESIARDKEVLLLDRMDYICNDAAGICLYLGEDYTKYFYDGSHHTLEGARFFAGIIDESEWSERLIHLVE